MPLVPLVARPRAEAQRAPRPPKPPRVVLTPELVQAIRARYLEGETWDQLRRQFGVSAHTISAALRDLTGARAASRVFPAAVRDPIRARYLEGATWAELRREFRLSVPSLRVVLQGLVGTRRRAPKLLLCPHCGQRMRRRPVALVPAEGVA